MKNYIEFKIRVEKIIEELLLDGFKVTPKKWSKVSPYQKRRYKREYQYPEVWLYRKHSPLGMVLTGEDIKSFHNKMDKLKEYISTGLF